jgi:hypothetical protein
MGGGAAADPQLRRRHFDGTRRGREAGALKAGGVSGEKRGKNALRSGENPHAFIQGKIIIQVQI